MKEKNWPLAVSGKDQLAKKNDSPEKHGEEKTEKTKSMEQISESVEVLNRCVVIAKEIEDKYGDMYATLKSSERMGELKKTEENIKLYESMKKGYAETLGDGVRLLCTVIESIVKNIQQNAENFSNPNYIDDKLERLKKNYGNKHLENQYCMLDLCGDILNDIRDKKIIPENIDFDFISKIAERIESTMDRIHQYGDPRLLNADVGKFNMAKNNLYYVKNLIKLAKEKGYEVSKT